MTTLLFFFYNLIFIVVSISVSYSLKNSYHDDINSFIGYRTKRSMSSKQAWSFANKYSSNLLFNYSIGCVLIEMVVLYYFGGKAALFSAASIWVFLFVIIAIQTEFKLKKYYPKSKGGEPSQAKHT